MIWDNVREQMAAQCAPLLAGLKPSNLLILSDSVQKELYQILKQTQFSSFLLAEYDGKQVYLLYHAKELFAYLKRIEVQKLLAELGYAGIDFYSLLQKVAKRYASHKTNKTEFPHELGLLLGYPAVDVRGFMEHKGKDYLYSGYWKVYGNVTETTRLFYEFGKAKQLIMQQIARGCTISEIATMYGQDRHYRLAAG